MMIVLALAVVLIWLLLQRRNKNAESRISLDDLLLGDDGKMSKSAAVMFGAFALTTWTIIYLTLNEKLTEGYFGAYIAAWVAPAVSRIIKGPAPPQGPAPGP
jgi:hypothetical protein